MHPILVLLMAAIAAGCGGGEDPPASWFTAADARRLASIAPTSPEWKWPTKPSSTGVSDPNEVPETADDPHLAQLYDKLRDLEDLGGANSKWMDDDKLANLNVNALGTVPDAQTATNAYREFLHAWGDDFGEVTKDEDVDGLGDEAWVISIEGNGTQVSYEWRTGNLLASAHMHCYGSCPADVDGAAREWAEAIDGEVRAAS